ncbi:hypothetical protein A374_02164 [Fictibacillus macauensis ZFHKF-1]|uniref:Uncharacterized protein n=1 Tax=Fictibacillus macauensis ZFHKF-1 TaxID=1196324 RepID=I8UJH7_9BACL|nr:tetratricopeptide repeat protein [Fictibacillus macauensis]EIT87020.1 hypothetical protein A374_02164 [Fictibacillus macauensis ZFHKF-1]
MKKEKHAERDMRILPFRQDGERFFQRGMKAYRQKEYQKAIRLFQRAVELQPEEPTYYCQLASTLAEIGEYDRSNEYLEQVIDAMGQDISECYFFMANNYAHLGMFSEAEAYAAIYIKKDPTGEFVPDAKELLELIHFEVGSEALSEEEELILTHEEARQSIVQGNLKEAKKQLGKLIEKHPTFWAAYNNLALTHFYLDEYDEALSVLRSILGKNPGNLNALCNIAIILDHMGKKSEALQMMDALKNVYPIHPDHRYKLGTTFGMFHEHAYANRWLSSIQRHYYGNDPAYLHLLAVSCYATGQKERGMRAWRKIEEIDPGKEVAAYYLKKAANNELVVTGTDYQYRIPVDEVRVSQEQMPKNTFAARFNQVASGFHKGKLMHLCMLRGDTTTESITLLTDFCLRKEEHPVLKQLAASLLLEMNAAKTVTITQENEQVTMSTIPDMMKHGLAILSYLKEHETAIDDDVTFLWIELMSGQRFDTTWLRNEKALAAAIDYVSKKRKSGTTQAKIAERYGISVSMLSSRIQFLKRGLERAD